MVRRTVAFDIIGTTFSLEGLRPALVEAGAPPHVLELWFAQTLRDYFGLSHAGGYVPLKDVLEASLRRILVTLELEAADESVDLVMGRLAELEPSAGAREAFVALTDADAKVIALTNGSAGFTRGLLQRAGLDSYVAAVLSCDEVRVSKPHRRVYDYARGEAEGELWMIGRAHV